MKISYIKRIAKSCGAKVEDGLFVFYEKDFLSFCAVIQQTAENKIIRRIDSALEKANHETF